MHCIQFFGILMFCCVSISTVTALNCYQCNSHTQPECADLKAHPPHKVAVFHQPCNETDFDGNKAELCRIISYKFKFLKKTDKDSSRVIRTCGYRRAQKDCYAVDSDHHLETVCQCFGDGCNSAANVSILSLISTVVIATLNYMFV